VSPEDQDDYGKFLEGITFFMQLAPEQILEHMKLHREDAFSQIGHFSGEGSAPCTKDGMSHLRALVQRRVQALTRSKDFDFEEVVKGIAEHIGPSLQQGVWTCPLNPYPITECIS